MALMVIAIGIIISCKIFFYFSLCYKLKQNVDDFFLLQVLIFLLVCIIIVNWFSLDINQKIISCFFFPW